MGEMTVSYQELLGLYRETATYGARIKGYLDEPAPRDPPLTIIKGLSLVMTVEEALKVAQSTYNIYIMDAPINKTTGKPFGPDTQAVQKARQDNGIPNDGKVIFSQDLQDIVNFKHAVSPKLQLDKFTFTPQRTAAILHLRNPVKHATDNTLKVTVNIPRVYLLQDNQEKSIVIGFTLTSNWGRNEIPLSALLLRQWVRTEQRKEKYYHALVESTVPYRVEVISLQGPELDNNIVHGLDYLYRALTKEEYKDADERWLEDVLET